MVALDSVGNVLYASRVRYFNTINMAAKAAITTPTVTPTITPVESDEDPGRGAGKLEGDGTYPGHCTGMCGHTKLRLLAKRGRSNAPAVGSKHMAQRSTASCCSVDSLRSHGNWCTKRTVKSTRGYVSAVARECINCHELMWPYRCIHVRRRACRTVFKRHARQSTRSFNDGDQVTPIVDGGADAGQGTSE